MTLASPLHGQRSTPPHGSSLCVRRLSHVSVFMLPHSCPLLLAVIHPVYYILAAAADQAHADSAAGGHQLERSYKLALATLWRTCAQPNSTVSPSLGDQSLSLSHPSPSESLAQRSHTLPRIQRDATGPSFAQPSPVCTCHRSAANMNLPPIPCSSPTRDSMPSLLVTAQPTLLFHLFLPARNRVLSVDVERFRFLRQTTSRPASHHVSLGAVSAPGTCQSTPGT